MSRPMKLRQVAVKPAVTFFKPAGVPMSALNMVTLALEEVEAIRLKDLEDLQQEDCAERMGVSRATFHHVLGSGRAKLADAILNGKAIRVEGGAFVFPGGRFRCRRDGSEWALSSDASASVAPVVCPTCRGRDVQPVYPGQETCHRGRGRGGWRHGRCRRAGLSGGEQSGAPKERPASVGSE